MSKLAKLEEENAALKARIAESEKAEAVGLFVSYEELDENDNYLPGDTHYLEANETEVELGYAVPLYLHPPIAPDVAALQKERDELAAQNVQLREALTTCGEDWNDGCYGTSSYQYYDKYKVKQALALQPPEALREIEARVLDWAADQFDNQYTDSCPSVSISKELLKMAAAKRKGE